MVVSNGSSTHFHAFFRPTKFNIVACLLTVIALVYCAHGYWSLRALVDSQSTQLALLRLRNNELRMRETELSESLDSLNKRIELVLESERNYKQRYTICSDEKQAADGSLAAKSTELATAEQRLSECRAETSDLQSKSDECTAQLNRCNGGAEALGRSERNATAQMEALRSKLKQQDEELAAASAELRTLRAASKYRASVAEDEAICDNTWFAKIGRLLRSGQSPTEVLLTLGFRRSDIQAAAERQLAVNNLRQSSLYGGSHAVDYEQQALRDRVQNIRSRSAEGTVAVAGTADGSAMPSFQRAPGSEQNTLLSQDPKPVASELPDGSSRGEVATAVSQVPADQTVQHQDDGQPPLPEANQAQPEQVMQPSQNQPEEQQQPKEAQPQPEEQQQPKEAQPQPEEQQQPENQQSQPEEQQQPEKQQQQEQQLPEDPQRQPEGLQQRDDGLAGNIQVQQQAQQQDQQPSPNQQQQQQQDDQPEQHLKQQPEQESEQQKNGPEEMNGRRAPAAVGYLADEPDHPESSDDHNNRAAIDDKVAQYVADAAADDAAPDRAGNEAGEGKDDGQGYDDANNDPADDDEEDDDVVDDGVIADGVNDDDDDIDPKAYANGDDRDDAYNQANDDVGDGDGDGVDGNVNGPYPDNGDAADKQIGDNADNAQDGGDGAADEDVAGDDGPPAEEDEDMPVDNR